MRAVADDADDALEIERIVAEGDGLGLAMDDLAVMVHLAQPAFGVGLVGGHDAAMRLSTRWPAFAFGY